MTDDASGTAAVLELARVMSKYQFRKTLVFVAFVSRRDRAGREQGLRSRGQGKRHADRGGSEQRHYRQRVAGNGRASSSTLRVFAGGPEDSPGRALLRYTKLIAERYVPSMKVDMIFHGDRFNRAGDHLKLLHARLRGSSLDYAPRELRKSAFGDRHVREHIGSLRRPRRENERAVSASLALAPPPPVVNWTFLSGDRKGDRSPLLNRGKSGYDAVMRWEPSVAQDLAGYAVVIRSTTSPDWEREIWVGNATSYVLKDFSIDDVVLGIKAVDRDGNQSLVSAYLEPVTQQLTAPPAAPPE